MKLLGYMPDADPLEDGALLECNHIIPTYRGIASAPSEQDANVTVLAAACIGAASLTKIGGDTRTFAGTTTKLYEQSSGNWADVSEGGSTYTTVVERWRYAQYGDVSLATNKENVLQYSNSSGAFAKVTSTATGSTVTAPAAAIVEVVNDFVFLANTTGVVGHTGDEQDRWIASALGDYADWTPDSATQCVTGRLTSVPGKIVALRKFGDQIVAYKERGMYLGSYLGPPIIWSFPEIPTARIGTFSQESVISLGTAERPLHFFVGADDFYLFDGAQPIPIGSGVKEKFFSELNVGEAEKICLVLNRTKSLVYIHYPAGGSTSLDSCLVFNYRTKRWGRDDRTIEFAFEYIAPGLNYDDLGTYYSTYADLPSSPYDEAFAGSNAIQTAYFDTSHDLMTLSGSGGDATFTTMHFGSDDSVSCVTRLRPRWIIKPSTATMSNYYWMGSGETPSLDTSTAMESGQFDFLRSANWHQFDFTISGDFELNSMNVEAVRDGDE